MHNLESITTGKKEMPPRIVLLGTPKVGKTSFACGALNAIIIPIKGEEGADDMDVAKFPTVNTYDELIEALTTLATQDHDYKTVIIDSASTLEPLVWDKTVECDKFADSIELVGGGYSKGYIEALTHWRRIMDGLDHLRTTKGMTSIVIGHVMVKQFNDPMSEPYDKYIWNIHHKAAAIFTQWADSVLFAKMKDFVTVDKDSEKKNRATSVGERKLYTQERPAHPGGGRGLYGRLPYDINLDWASFVEAIKAVK